MPLILCCVGGLIILFVVAWLIDAAGFMRVFPDAFYDFTSSITQYLGYGGALIATVVAPLLLGIVLIVFGLRHKN